MFPCRCSLQPAVIALTGGLFPCARPFSPTSLGGKNSLLGENLSPSVQACLEQALYLAGKDAKQGKGLGIPLVLSAPGEEKVFSVPAVVYLAGEASSTFDVARKLLEADALPAWGAVLAASQTEGRGQFRRSWHSPPGNLYVTFRLPEEIRRKGGAASVCVGYLLAAALRRLGFPLLLKWPNDLLSEEQSKVGGILLEEREGALLAGLGLNLVEAPLCGQMRSESAILAGILSKAPPPFFLWRSLVEAVIVEYTQSIARRGLSEIMEDFAPFLAWINSPVTVTDGDNVRIAGLHAGIGPEGELLLRLETGEIRSVCSGSLFPGAA
ncbi:MAG: biotin--[acetyl-CoA-carboxylase] ligase [Deltaproteobacteria bacterium]|jgi:BirA family biotin operon repressor/biotin-[acetyl-CoA-carboxylase] ligase|nr:biotin--[acetyl-CoA-carboxylase] ligase [Deltaproteobacteria bacterium]